MIKTQKIIPAALITGAVFLVGCINDGSESKPAKNELTTAAVVASNNWTVAFSPGFLPAFANTGSNPFWGWALDKTYSPKPQGGWAIRRFSSTTSSIVFPGGLVDLDIRGSNQLFGVNENGSVFWNDYPYSVTTPWKELTIPTTTLALRVAAGNDDVWILTNETVAGGNKLYKWKGTGLGSDSWIPVAGGMKEIDVDNNKDLWGVNDQGYVFRLPGGNPTASWDLKPFADAKDIAVGGGKAFVITSSPATGGKAMKKWNGTGWTDIPGGAVNIQVDGGGRLWSGNDQNQISYYTP
ncbi:MAG: tectonin domain-containing protein [Fibrobacteria bacterium]